LSIKIIPGSNLFSQQQEFIANGVNHNIVGMHNQQRLHGWRLQDLIYGRQIAITIGTHAAKLEFAGS
jgi:hypothetical protein